MKYDSKIHHRQSIRLKNYDYAQAGLYFVTIATQNREHYFGEIANGEMLHNDAGNMITNGWLKLTERFPDIQLHTHVVMPNHFHAILEITPVGAPLVGAQIAGTQTVDTKNNTVNHENGQSNKTVQPSQTGQPQGIAPTGHALGDIIGAFKSITTVEYIRGVKNKHWRRINGKLWQRNYWEHIVRNENEYYRITQYIIDNPIKWDMDQLNVGNTPSGSSDQAKKSTSEYTPEVWMV